MSKSNHQHNALRLGHELAELLDQRQLKIVFAESCTGGLVAATLVQNPGISQWFCGSSVVYREATKHQWLGVGLDELRKHSAVSPEVTRTMARAALERTPEASIAVAITGHLEDAASHSGAFAWIAIASRTAARILVKEAERFQLDASDRIARQWQATSFAVRATSAFIASHTARSNGG